VDLGIDEELLAHLQAELGSVQNELVELRTKAARLKEELETIWADEKNMEYELTSVFVHRGSSPSWGHYFFYSRCLPHKPDMWFKYNDSEVTLVKQDEVLADTTGSTANPYLVGHCYS
jgi:ubiquitin carboxyl-terminal hydrolase 25/28